jgi:DNA-directed RNA polymerase specialized sigma24 family protein
MTKLMTKLLMNNEMLIRNSVEEDAAVFQLRFFRCRRLLRFIATRVLRDSDRVDDAIENCWLSASRNPPQFDYESAFRSWLLRVLIDEALAIRHTEEELKRRTAAGQVDTGDFQREPVRDTQCRVRFRDRHPATVC